MPVASILHIGGWPGVGKFTIGQVVARMLGGRLIDNHLMLDAAQAVYERGTPGCAQLREDVRKVIFEHARNLPDDVPIVLTDALADEAASLPLFAPAESLARDRGARLQSFVLDLTPEENERRLMDPARSKGAKLMDVEVLRDLRANAVLFRPANAVTLDVTELSADEAARIICDQVRHPHG